MKFLNWYIDEQVEEEASVDGVLTTLRLIGEDKNALLLLDKEAVKYSNKKNIDIGQNVDDAVTKLLDTYGE